MASKRRGLCADRLESPSAKLGLTPTVSILKTAPVTHLLLHDVGRSSANSQALRLVKSGLEQHGLPNQAGGLEEHRVLLKLEDTIQHFTLYSMFSSSNSSKLMRTTDHIQIFPSSI